MAVDEGPPIPYDTLVVAAGAVTATYDVAGVAEHAFGLKSLADAYLLRNHVLRRFEAATIRRRRSTTVPSPSWWPAADRPASSWPAACTSCSRWCWPRTTPASTCGRARVVLVEMSDRLLGTFAPRLSAQALRTLRRRGVEVLLGVGVDKVEADAVHLSDGTRIPTADVGVDGGREAEPAGRRPRARRWGGVGASRWGPT